MGCAQGVPLPGYALLYWYSSNKLQTRDISNKLSSYEEAWSSRAALKWIVLMVCQLSSRLANLLF
jgi:hypothetical protein